MAVYHKVISLGELQVFEYCWYLCYNHWAPLKYLAAVSSWALKLLWSLPVGGWKRFRSGSSRN